MKHIATAAITSIALVLTAGLLPASATADHLLLADPAAAGLAGLVSSATGYRASAWGRDHALVALVESHVDLHAGG